MKFCSNCGLKLEENASFCGGCGSRIIREQNNNSQSNIIPLKIRYITLAIIFAIYYFFLESWFLPAIGITIEGIFKMMYSKYAKNDFEKVVDIVAGIFLSGLGFFYIFATIIG